MKRSLRQPAGPAFLLVVVLASCGPAASKQSPAGAGGDAAAPSAAATPAPGPQGGHSPAAARPGPSGAGSLAAAVGQVEQSVAAAKAALSADDIDTMANAMATGRQGLSRVNALLPRANLAPAKLQAARAAAATLDACCSQAEAALRTGQDGTPSQLEALAQQLDTAVASLKASTAGAP
jgi:hypothetical protein